MPLLIRTASVLCLLPFTNVGEEKISPSCVVLPGIIAAFVEPSRKTRSETDFAILLCTAKCAMRQTLFCKLHVAHLALLVATAWPSHLYAAVSFRHTSVSAEHLYMTALLTVSVIQLASTRLNCA